MKKLRRRRCKGCGDLYEPNPRNRRHQRYCSKPSCRKTSKTESHRRWLNKPKNRNHFRGSENVRRVREWREKNPDYAGRTRSKTSKPPSVSQDANTLQPDDIQNEIVTYPGLGPALANAKGTESAAGALQDVKCTQPVDNQANIASLTGEALTGEALQDVLSAQPIDIQGKSASLTGLALQDVLSSQPVILIGLIANLTGSALQEDIAETARRLQILGQDILKGGMQNKGGKDADKTSVVPNPPAPDPPAV